MLADERKRMNIEQVALGSESSGSNLSTAKGKAKQSIYVFTADTVMERRRHIILLALSPPPETIIRVSRCSP